MGLYSYNVVNAEPLPELAVSRKPTPPGWQSKIAELQDEYLKQTDQQPRHLDQTLKRLNQIALGLSLGDIENNQALSYAALHLEPLHQLFSNPDITELFGNQLGKPLIVTHLQHGKCRTNILFDPQFWNALRIRGEYDSGKPLNSNHPTLKIGYVTDVGHLRISMQVEPISATGPLLTIRRLPSSALTIETLIEQGQVPEEVATLLTEAIKHRQNLVIAGEPGSGKTTLANALLLKSNPAWRTIVMEDAREISIDRTLFPLLTHYAMPVVGSNRREGIRSDEISRLLHRSPDYVFLGEIQNATDTRVTFEGFAAGLRGLATTHARHFKGLIQRWEQSHQLPPDLIQSIDWIVLTTRRFDGKRFHLGIGELWKIDGTLREKLYG